MAHGNGRLRVMALRILGLATSVALSSVVAVTPLMGAYRVTWAPAVLWGAAPAAVAIAFLASRYYKIGSVSSLTMSVVVLAAVALAICQGNVATLWDVLDNGPRDLLTETLPLGGGVSALVPLLIAEWMSAAVSAEVVARTLPVPDATLRRGKGQSSRPPAGLDSRRGVLALSIPLAVYLGSFSAASASPSQSRASGPELLVTMAMTAALLHELSESNDLLSQGSLGSDLYRRESPAATTTHPVGPTFAGEHTAPKLAARFGPFARATAASVLAASVLALVVPPSLNGSAKPLALHLQAQVLTPVIDDPVDELARLRDDNGSRPVPLGSVIVSGPQTRYLQAAVLDDYTGGLWSFKTTFVPTGGRIPDASPAGSRTLLVRQKFDLTASWPIPLLPAVSRPSEISGGPVDADGVTGMILKGSASPGARYAVTSRISTVTFAQLPSSSQIDLQAGGTADVELPDGAQSYVSATVGFLAYLTGIRPSATVAFLEASLRALRADDRWIDPSLSSSPPLGGTSLAQVINAVTVDRAATPEQFATFFAVAARLLGVPSRVVTGIRLATSKPSAGSNPSTFKLNSTELWTWVEVPVVGRGWLVVDPTPPTATAAGRPPHQPAQTVPTTVASPVAVAAPGPGSGEQHAVAPPAPTQAIAKRGSSSWAVAVMVSLVVAVFAAGLSPSLRRKARRRRRVLADPPGQVLGAWSEILERAERLGMRLPEASTNAEVAVELAAVYGPDVLEPAGRVALLAERVVFNPSAQLGFEDIDRLWQAESEVRAAIRVDLRQQVGLRVRRIRTMAAMVALGRSKGSGRP